MTRPSWRGARGGAALPVSVSVHLPALGRWEDAHELPVLGDGAARDIDVLLGENLGDVLIAERMAGILADDDGADAVLDALGRHLVAVGLVEAGGEEELELEDSLRGVHVLVGGG